MLEKDVNQKPITAIKAKPCLDLDRLIGREPENIITVCVLRANSGEIWT